MLSFAPWVAAAVVLLLVVVVASYRQLVKAYPSGGGDYEVAHKNLGEKAGLVVASALLVDYILTVTVSVASGVDNIISAVPALNPLRVELAVFFVILLVAMNLRGVAESSKLFALPTYLFIGSVFIMVVVGAVRTALGDIPVAESAEFTVKAVELTQVGVILLLLRAFASGWCLAVHRRDRLRRSPAGYRRDHRYRVTSHRRSDNGRARFSGRRDPAALRAEVRAPPALALLMIPAANLIAFGLASIPLIIIPGPSVLFTIGRSLSLGRVGGLLTVVGNSMSHSERERMTSPVSRSLTCQ